MTLSWRGAALGLLVLAAACGRDPERGGEFPPPPAGIPANLRPDLIQIDPTGVAASVAGEVVAGRPDRPDALPVLNGTPAHLRFAFDGDTLPDSVEYRQRQVRVFPLPAYRATFVGGTRAVFERRLAALAALIAMPAGPVTGEIPVFPPVAEEQVFRGRIRWIDFDGGRGIAFLAHYARDRDPVAGDRLVWIFQGLTDDGAWLVAASHPVRTDRLPPTTDARRVAEVLDGLASGDFQPDLDHLERMIASLRVASLPTV